MAYSYNEILERMEDKYYQLSGYRADECGDIGIRLRVLAGEIFSMGTQMDWLRKQIFFSTASGEMLDLHAAIKALSVSKAYIVSVGNECKELLLVLSRDKNEAIRVVCVNDDESFKG